MSAKIAVITLILILAIVNGSILQKERQLANGQVVYLKLAPVDPRSLMQGDYMALRFALANDIDQALRAEDSTAGSGPERTTSDGYVVVSLDGRNVASYRRLHQAEALADDELLLHYRVRDGRVKFATNAYFFQEGHAEIYQEAEYGQFRVSVTGKPLLAAMADQDLNRLGPDGRR